MSPPDEQIASLNQIIKMVDDQATHYKNERFTMRPAQAQAQKKLITDLIHNGLDIAERMSPKPLDVIQDLKKLEKQLSQMN